MATYTTTIRIEADNTVTQTRHIDIGNDTEPDYFAVLERPILAFVTSRASGQQPDIDTVQEHTRRIKPRCNIETLFKNLRIRTK